MHGTLTQPEIPALEAGALLTIDLGALADNWRKLQALAAPGECGAVVKANAYGLGFDEVIPTLWRAGCRTFFTALLSEGKRVRALAPEASIYVLNGLLPGTAPVYGQHRLRPALGSEDEISEWQAFIKAGNADPGAAIHVDTGLNRLGLRVEEAQALAGSTLLEGFEISLLVSHFIASEEPENPLNQAQIERFLAVQDRLQVKSTSLCNSSGFFLGAKPYMNLCRPGYALYGGNPTPDHTNPMRAVVKLQAKIVQIREVPAGETVGYNSQWTAKEPRRIAVLALGYADGITRQLAATDAKSGGSAIIAGMRCPFAGRVSMDLITVDITALPAGNVQRGDYAELIGDEISIDEIAKLGNTNGYEILTNLGRRYARHYISNV